MPVVHFVVCVLVNEAILFVLVRGGGELKFCFPPGSPHPPSPPPVCCLGISPQGGNHCHTHDHEARKREREGGGGREREGEGGREIVQAKRGKRRMSC